MDEDVDKMQVNINYFVHGATLDNEKKNCHQVGMMLNYLKWE